MTVFIVRITEFTDLFKFSVYIFYSNNVKEDINFIIVFTTVKIIKVNPVFIIYDSTFCWRICSRGPVIRFFFLFLGIIILQIIFSSFFSLTNCPNKKFHDFVFPYENEELHQGFHILF